MHKNHTILRCSKPTAFLFLFSIIALFVLVGCAALFRSAGLAPEEAAEKESEFREALAEATTQAVANVAEGLSEGHDLKSLALKTGSVFLWKILAAAGSSAGVILSGFLAKWLGTERKINRVLIAGVEDANGIDTKAMIHKKALDAGVESKLAARVRSLT